MKTTKLFSLLELGIILLLFYNSPIFCYPEGWSRDIQITSGSGETTIKNLRPKIVIDSNGIIHLIWSKKQTAPNTGRDLMYSYSSDYGETWSAPQAIASNANKYAWYHSIAIDSSNNIHVSWSDSRGCAALREEIYYRKKPAGAGWDPEVKVTNFNSTCAYRQLNTSISIDSTNTPHVAFSINKDGNYEIYATKAPWASFDRITTDSVAITDYLTSMQMKGSNRIIGWSKQQSAGGRYDIYYYDDSYNPPASGAVYVSDAIQSLNPFLDKDSADNFHLVWEEGTTPPKKILYSIYSGGSWSPTPAQIDNSVNSEVPSITLEGTIPNFVWSNPPDKIYYQKGEPPSIDDLLIVDIADTATVTTPFILYKNNQLFIVWEDQRSGFSEVYFKRTYYGRPTMLSATASDDSGEGEGIQAGDKVRIVFNESMYDSTIDASNIDTFLSLSGGHSWKDGSGNIGSTEWTTTNVATDTLIITLSTTTSTPTVVVGDIVTPATDSLPEFIQDVDRNFATGTVTITGSFGISPIQAVYATDTYDDNGLTITASWSETDLAEGGGPNQFKEYRVFVKDSPMANYASITPPFIASTTVTSKASTSVNLVVPANDTNYYVAVTVATNAGGESRLCGDVTVCSADSSEPTVGDSDYGPVQAKNNWFEVSLVVGFNLIALPLTPYYSYNAEQLINPAAAPPHPNGAIANCTQISKWDKNDQTWVTHIKGEVANNFTIDEGWGYFILRITSPTTYTFHGIPVAAPLTYDLKSGFNMISMPHQCNTCTAEALLDNIPGGVGSQISRWDLGDQGWKTHLKDQLAENFPIIKEEGYFLNVTSDVIGWTPSF